MKVTFQPSALESALASMQACSSVHPAEVEEHARESRGSGAGSLDASPEAAEEETHA